MQETLNISDPLLWDLTSPHLYTASVYLLKNGKTIDNSSVKFGIRSINFDAAKGFFLNGKPVKIKGVNMHHDAGSVGAAVPKAVWEYRVKKLQSIGCNAIRMSHNPHSPELMDVCDEQGMLVMAEAFDEWDRPKEKSKVFLGDNAAPEEAARSYTRHFNAWAEKDLKDLIRRDFNHPSVILWSIGNEIEWTFPYYTKTYDAVNGKQEYFSFTPSYDRQKIKPAFDKLSGGNDTLRMIATKLYRWVKEADTTRPVTAGSVQPSVSFVSGYLDNVDIAGFNYRAPEYDAAHAAYPNKRIIGTENYGSWHEWEAIKKRDFIAGMFVWTGFAYMGEAGPWPRKGLNISFFDFAGFKTPRGHFFECLWKDDPKVYMITTEKHQSEFSIENGKWQFTPRKYEPKNMAWLRRWEWYDGKETWNYNTGDSIIVQGYSNCNEAALFVNGKNMGKKSVNDFDDHIIKWMIPYQPGTIKIIGYNYGKEVARHIINTNSSFAKIQVTANKIKMKADGYDAVHVEVRLTDANGNTITNKEEKIEYQIIGNAKLIGIDNGWEKNIQPSRANDIITHDGKAMAVIQAGTKPGKIKIVVKAGNISSNEVWIDVLPNK